MEERISKQELMKMYKVNRSTIEEWRRRFGLPMIEIISQKIHQERGFNEVGESDEGWDM